MQLTGFGDQGTDADAGIHPSVLTQITDAAAVGIAPHRLQLLDDLHRPDLGSPCDGAAGEAGPQQIHFLPARIQFSVNGGDQMMHRREGFHGKEMRHSDRSGRLTRPMSLRSRSTIIRFSDLSLSALASDSATLASWAGSGGEAGCPDGLGLDMALVEQQETLRERLRMALCGRRTKAENGALLAALRAR